MPYKGSALETSNKDFVSMMPTSPRPSAAVEREESSPVLLLYWWPTDGWQRGTVARLCPRGAFSHVVAYTRQTSALRGTADTLLDAASYGSRWVLLSPAPAGGVILRPRAPRP